MDNAKNFAKVTVDGPYDDVETSVDLIGGDGAKLPTLPFNAVWWNATDYPDPADDPFVEIVRVTAIATDALTVSRGHEGTGSEGVAGLEHALEGKLYRMAAGLTAKAINDDLPIVFRRIGDVFYVISGGNKDIVIGDPDAEWNATVIMLQDGLARISAVCAEFGVGGKLGIVDHTTASVGVGTIVRKIPVYDGSDFTTPIGYIPIYDAIT